MLPNLNRQYNNQINQRSAAQRLVNMSMLILRTQHLLLMTPPGLQTNYLIANYWSLSAISYLFLLPYFLYRYMAVNGNDESLIAILLLVEYFV